MLSSVSFWDDISSLPNRMTGLYSSAILSALQYINLKIVAFTPPDFITFAIIACAVFLFFNQGLLIYP